MAAASRNYRDSSSLMFVFLHDEPNNDWPVALSNLCLQGAAGSEAMMQRAAFRYANDDIGPIALYDSRLLLLKTCPPRCEGSQYMVQAKNPHVDQRAERAVARGEATHIRRRSRNLTV